MKGLLRLYPRAWRQRYGQELSELAEEAPGWRTQIDLLRGAIDAWTNFGENEMKRSITALAAATLVLPSIFLTSNLVGEIQGRDGSEFLSGVFRSPIGEAVVVFGPFLALALLAVTTIRLERREPGIVLTMSMTRLQVMLMVTAAGVAASFVGYAFLENFVPRNG